MNSVLSERWVNEIFGRRSFQKRLLAWVSYEAHLTNDMQRFLVQSGCEQVIVAGGCTNYIQAPDLLWNKPFKAKIVEYYDEWIENVIHEYTAAGNLKHVPW